MPASCAQERRAEIESDLWELQHDPDMAPGATAALHILARLVAGFADDIAWRLEHLSPADAPLAMRAAVAAAMAGVVVVLWIWSMTFDWTAVGGRRQVAACANTLPSPQSATELRLQIVQCAGAFFATRTP